MSIVGGVWASGQKVKSTGLAPQFRPVGDFVVFGHRDLSRGMIVVPRKFSAEADRTPDLPPFRSEAFVDLSVLSTAQHNKRTPSESFFIPTLIVYNPLVNARFLFPKLFFSIPGPFPLSTVALL